MYAAYPLNMTITFSTLLKDFSPWLRAFPITFPTWNSILPFSLVLDGCWEPLMVSDQGSDVISATPSVSLAMVLG